MISPLESRRPSAVGQVLAELRGSIESGEVGMGERLPSEAALAARYSVSRAVVREVLRTCEALGLTVTRTGRGTFVVASRPGDLVFDGYSAASLMEARPGIEVPGAALAASRRTDEQVAGLHDLLARMDAESDVVVWTRLDAAFHLAIAVASGNPVFAAVLSSIGVALSGQSAVLDVQGGRRAAATAEHRAIASAIGRGAATEAEDAMRHHLDEVRDALHFSLRSP